MNTVEVIGTLPVAESVGLNVYSAERNGWPWVVFEMVRSKGPKASEVVSISPKHIPQMIVILQKEFQNYSSKQAHNPNE